MTGLNRGCGQGGWFPSADRAEIQEGRIALIRGGPVKFTITPCPHGRGGVHLAEADAAGEDGFPPKVIALLDARDPWCAWEDCGAVRGLQRHHRRIRGIGGDDRDHANCACNGVRLCLVHHALVHDTAAGRKLAEARGLIIPRAEPLPWRRPLRRYTPDGALALEWPACDGGYLEDMPEGGLAA